MKTYTLTLAAAVLALATLAPPATAQVKLPRISPDATVKQTVGLTDLTVTYSRPGVKGRAVWGALVPYDEPWRTGANNATTFETSDPITFGGQKVPAGKYGLATVPGKDTWVVILNSQSEAWGTQYDETKDVVRVEVSPQAAPHQEWMSIAFEDFQPADARRMPDQANLVIHWEKVRVAVPIQVDMKTQALANYREAVGKAKPEEWRTFYSAARFCFYHEVGLDEARGWLEKSIAAKKNYANLSLLAQWQMKDGKSKEAVASAKEAIAAAKGEEGVDTSDMEKLVAEAGGKKKS